MKAIIGAFLAAPIAVAFAIGVAQSPSAQTRTVGEYATTLVGRTPNQTHNAALALREIRGVTIAPGDVFSFNQRLEGWTARDGYRKAPVSYNGQLIDSWGGGVCQTSTTLYNAALLAGCEIIEKHPHQFAPSYVSPGRDAAVAYETVDLRFRNPHSFPLRISGEVRNQTLFVRLVGVTPPMEGPKIVTEIIATHAGETFDIGRGPIRRVRNSGKLGYEYSVWRIWPDSRRELIGRGSTPVMHRVVEHRESFD